MGKGDRYVKLVAVSRGSAGSVRALETGPDDTILEAPALRFPDRRLTRPRPGKWRLSGGQRAGSRN